MNPSTGGNGLPKSPARASLDATLLSLSVAIGVSTGVIGVAAGPAHGAPGSDATPPRWPGAPVERVLDVRPGDDLVFTLASDTARAICRLHPLTDDAGAGTSVYALVGGNGLYPSPASAQWERRTDDADGLSPPPMGLPIALAAGEIGYVWRGTGADPLFTRITPVGLYDPDHPEEIRAMRYLAADVLPPGSSRVAPPSSTAPTAIPAARQRLMVVDPSVTGATLAIAYPDGATLSVLLLQATAAGGYRVVDRAPSWQGSAGRIGVEVRSTMDQAVLIRWVDGDAPVAVEVAPLAPGSSPADVSSPAGATPSGGRAQPPGIVLGTGGWRRIADDDGEPDSYWGQIAGSDRALLKVLMLDADPRAIRAAALEYRIQAQPYSVGRRAGLGRGASADDFDTNLVIEVNGVEVRRDPLAAAATLGWHQSLIDPTLLRVGRNEIRFGVDGRDYVYVGLDLDTANGRSASIVGDRVDWTSLRPAYHVGPGEYMIRLMIRE